MKKIILYLLIPFFACAFTACKKMDSLYQEYIVPGGITYAAKATLPLVYSGHNRIKIAWLRGSDASVTKAKVFWNNRQDSVVINVPATGDTVYTIVSNLQEKQYNFVVITYNDKGNSSVPVELLGESFGTRYESLLLARPVVTGETDATGALTINWGAANTTGGAYATDVQYTNTSNVTSTKRFLTAETASAISDYKPGTTYQYRTVYSPGTRSIDLFYTPYIKENVSSKISKAAWIASTDSYALTSKLPNGPVINAIDDNLSTFWHTETTSTKVYPHWLAIDMKKQYNITRIELSCVQDNAATSTFTAFKLQTSTDGITWTDFASFSLVLKNGTQSFVLPETLNSRYVRIYATAGVSYFASLAEFSAFGYE